MQENMSPEELLAEIKKYAARGEQLSAYDLSVKALEKYPDDLWIRHQSVLSLARAGATDQAIARYETLALEKEQHEDIKSLKARLQKDLALSYPQEERTSYYATAAHSYESIYKETQGYYPEINAATLYFLAGENGKSKALAKDVLEKIQGDSTDEMRDAYYREATRAEACILLEAWKDAEKHLSLAKYLSGQDFSSVATTRKQLLLICPKEKLHLLENLKNPKVLHYSGHRIDTPGCAPSRFLPEDEKSIKASIEILLKKNDVGFGFGSLACGSDILFAEALLERNANLEIYLPFCIEEFLEISVRPGGPSWEKRFTSILDKVSRVYFATEDQYLGDDSLFNYCSQLAMGQAILRAQSLETEALQIAVWDGQPSFGIAGTAVDLQCWNKLGYLQEIIKLPNYKDPKPEFFQDETIATSNESSKGRRVLRAILFGDIKGFSKLKEVQISSFVKEILGVFGNVLDKFAEKILFRNTWGDGLFVILPDVQTAAACAMELQKELKKLIDVREEFATHSLRLAAHFGPVIEQYDPVLKKTNFFGVHVSRAARVEPVTPEGKVYATWPFASQLAMLKNSPVKADYVGHLPAAKSYGHIKMYVLKNRN
ncbi:MAG: adenylate/guanylate cyclase domain-containing protein [Sideroxyarcus sp.]|nr:adenylate/guanylate cyclase domain-containing protein [Sideroxyarcus sp.]